MENFIEATIVTGKNDEIKEKTLLSVSNIIRIAESNSKCYILSRLFIKNGKCEDVWCRILEPYSEIVQKLK